MRESYPTSWDEQIPLVLWAYRMSKRRPTGFTPYSLVYGAEVILPVELAVPSARIALAHHLLPNSRYVQLERLDKRRDKAKEILRDYKKQLARAYTGLVKERKFSEGDLVLKVAEHII